jgi:hypothetical protein
MLEKKGAAFTAHTLAEESPMALSYTRTPLIDENMTGSLLDDCPIVKACSWLDQQLRSHAHLLCERA